VSYRSLRHSTTDLVLAARGPTRPVIVSLTGLAPGTYRVLAKYGASTGDGALRSEPQIVTLSERDHKTLQLTMAKSQAEQVCVESKQEALSNQYVRRHPFGSCREDMCP
jgi:hypothetical protein